MFRLLGFAVISAVCLLVARADGPNVLLIVADDLSGTRRQSRSSSWQVETGSSQGCLMGAMRFVDRSDRGK